MSGRLKVAGGLLALLLMGLVVFALLQTRSQRAPAPAPGADAARADSVLGLAGDRPRVEVLNGAGVPGLARRATQHLRDRGVDVVHFGNASSFGRESTVVVARSDDLDAARRVAGALGLDTIEVEPDPELYLDATVQLGRDWPPPGEPEPTGLVGRLRGLFD